MSRRGFRIPKIRMPKMKRPRFRRPSRDTFRRMMPRRGGGWSNLTLPVAGLVGLMILILSGSILFKGCGSPNSQMAEQDDVTDNSAVTNQDQVGKKIVGEWSGRAGINQELLNLKLGSLERSQAAFVQRLAKEHLAAQLKAIFGTDGSLFIEVASSDPLATAPGINAKGTWKVIAAMENRVTVELDFVSSHDQTRKINRYELQFIGNDHVAMVAPTGPELSDCQPIYLFQKNKAQANVASDSAELLKK